VMTVLSIDGSGDACLSDVIISGENGISLNPDGGDCVTIDSCEDADADGICDDVDDCVGAYDECGVCNGDGIADGACDCDGNVEDCAGECGGSAVVDECGECGGDGIDEGACDCDGNVDVGFGCGVSAPENYPDWVDNPGDYEFTASMVAVVHHTLTGEQLDDPNDILAAFDASGNVRGIATSLYAPFGPYEGTNLWDIQLRSNAAGDALSFKYYDMSEDEVLAASPGYSFVVNDVIGSVPAPHEISAGAVTASVDIGEGWNWISLNVEGESMEIGEVLASLSSTGGDFIKTPSGTAEYFDGFGWYGSLAEWDVRGMYMLRSTNADNLVFSGAPVDPASTPIDLGEGWNWIGYLPQYDGSIVDALSSIVATGGDFIKTPSGTAEYFDGFGWYGSLESMNPTQGYMLRVAEASELTYPSFGPDDYVSDGLTRKDMPLDISDWVADYHDYEFNGNIAISIDNRTDADGDYIAVFVGNECRGVAERMYFPFNDSYMYSLMVYSNVAKDEELKFKYYDSITGDVVEYVETIDFTSDMIVGNGFNTFSLSREASDMPQPMTYGISDAYPNPFNPVTSFEYMMPEDGMVKVAVYDVNGRMVAELVNGYMSAGSHPVTWNANDLSSGVYMINMIAGDYSTIQKVMFIK